VSANQARSGGVAAWCIAHPVGTLTLASAVVVLGLFALGRLSVNLLPQIIYPQVVVRILDPGVSAVVMEDSVTRQLEEQLAITEDATGVESTTSEGNSEVTLSFDYGKDIDIALRDASTRLDRARRFLPTTIDPPQIYKRDPSQIPVLEYVLSSPSRGPVELRTWTDDVFAKWFLNLPGVAAVEVGGGLVREIHVLPDQQRLAGLGLTIADVISAIQRGNSEEPAGRLTLPRLEFGGRTLGRIDSLEELAALPLRLANGDTVPLAEVADVRDLHEDDRLRARSNGVPGVKVAVQKQPDANTVAVAEVVKARLAWLHANGLLPPDIKLDNVADQSTYVSAAMRNASIAALSGAVLAMIVVYLFLGSISRTLIIGSAIPLSILATFIIMSLSGLTLNIMTLGGIALGVGMLVDNTIVMLENITRHQAMGESPLQAGRSAVSEVTSAVIASTTTNLAAVLPFLFIGGLVGLVFRELIVTISAAIVASLIVAVTVVPSLAARVRSGRRGAVQARIDRVIEKLQGIYKRLLSVIVRAPARTAMVFALTLIIPWYFFTTAKSDFLPRMDDGRINIDVSTDSGMSVNAMDKIVVRLEKMAHELGHVDNVFTLVGGRIFGRSERETPNRSTIQVRLVPRGERPVGVREWAGAFNRAVSKAQIPGVKVRARPAGLRGLRLSQSSEEVSVRIQGPDLDELRSLGEAVAKRLRGVAGLTNVENSAEETRAEFAVAVDRERAADLGFDVADIGRAMRIALAGEVVSDYLEGDRSFPIRVRLPQEVFDSPEALHGVLLFGERPGHPAVYLGDVAKVTLVPVPAEIKRDAQRRIVEVTGSIREGATLGGVIGDVRSSLADFPLPEGYTLYYAGAEQSLESGKHLSYVLLGIALFLVFVVMAVQYESLRNPFVILLCVPFASAGAALAMKLSGEPVTMPVWLGLIMLAGIVVNNSIVLVEYIELLRERGMEMREAVVEAGRLRLRPILMTTLTTVVGMLPLAFGWGEGAEMLQPLAITITGGLFYGTVVSLMLVPAVYMLFHARRAAAGAGSSAGHLTGA